MSITLNQSADYWHYDIGVNVISANTKNKETYESWSSSQAQSIPDEVHESRKKSEYYNNGIAIIPGPTWRGPFKGMYLVACDLDNKKAIEEFCGDGLEELKQQTLVEQHADPNKMHIYFIVERSTLSIENIRRFYESVAIEGHSIDPLSQWFVLQRILKRPILLNLKNDALYAQKCYEISWMLANFIYDLTGEKVYEPDDIMDGNGHGAWKNKIYGDPFDYTTKRTQKNILDKFLVDRPFRAGIIFEGDTEQFVINEILRAIRVDQERDGFFLYNAKGISNIGKNLDALYNLAKLEDIFLFVILDNDNPGKTSKIKKDLAEFIKPHSIKFWERDFEYDNFDIDKMLIEINYTLKEKKLKAIEKEKINKKLESGMGLMKSIADTYYTENQIDIYEIVSKTDLAQKLIAPRILEIEKERFSLEGWKPTLPIEKILSEIFHIIPRFSFSYLIY